MHPDSSGSMRSGDLKCFGKNFCGTIRRHPLHCFQELYRAHFENAAAIVVCQELQGFASSPKIAGNFFFNLLLSYASFFSYSPRCHAGSCAFLRSSIGAHRSSGFCCTSFLRKFLFRALSTLILKSAASSGPPCRSILLRAFSYIGSLMR